jgi:aminoglycoside phosphotransferase (APT) family kinase protein
MDLAGACRRYLALPGSARLEAADRRRLDDLLDRAPVLGAECFVHGDAFPENFIDDGRRLWLIDWEYAGRGHPAADLAYVAMNLELPAAGIRALLAAHGGGVDFLTVQALLPVAAARDLLWCLSEIEARGLRPALGDYTGQCCRRLGVRWPKERGG